MQTQQDQDAKVEQSGEGNTFSQVITRDHNRIHFEFNLDPGAQLGAVHVSVTIDGRGS